MENLRRKQYFQRLKIHFGAVCILIILITSCDDIYVSLDLFLNEFLRITDRNIEFVLDDNVWIDTKRSDGNFHFATGSIDDKGRWHGDVTIAMAGSYSQGATIRVEAQLFHGLNHGIWKWYNEDDREIARHCYLMGAQVDCELVPFLKSTNYSAFQVLTERHSFLIKTLNAFGFNDGYIEAYTDTLETLLSEYEIADEDDFDSYYDDVIEILEETPYDSIIGANYVLSSYNILELLKHSQLRLAIIEKYKTDGDIFNILQTQYPGYLEALYEGDVDDDAIQSFCNDLEDSISTYPPLNPENPLFTFDIEAYMYQAVTGIYLAGEEGEISEGRKMVQAFGGGNIGSMIHELQGGYTPLQTTSGSAAVAEVVIFYIVMEYFEADLIRKSVKRAYFINEGEIYPPTVAAYLTLHNSATSVTFKAYVIDNGGEEASSHGIAWATHYNPTTDDNNMPSDSGTDSLQLTLDDLIEGETYFVRAYASNSSGISYSHCIEFVAQESDPSTYLDQKSHSDINSFTIYPNPASSLVNFVVTLDAQINVSLCITDILGQEVARRNLGDLPEGETQILLNLSALTKGTYICHLLRDNVPFKTCKLVFNP